LERDGDFTGRLALLELLRTMPSGAVWDRFCEIKGVPPESAWLEEIRTYESEVLSQRGA